MPNLIHCMSLVARGWPLGDAVRVAFPPTYTQVFSSRWDEERRLRQIAPFAVDRLDLAAHGTETPLT